MIILYQALEHERERHQGLARQGRARPRWWCVSCGQEVLPELGARWRRVREGGGSDRAQPERAAAGAAGRGAAQPGAPGAVKLNELRHYLETERSTKTVNF